MGYVNTISYDRFPKQEYIDLDVKVYYHDDTTNVHYGKVVRCDMEPPFETIILLDNGNLVRAAECRCEICR